MQNKNTKSKTGVLRSWGDRGFGIIVCGALERYFLHVCQIRSGTATPTAGMIVNFDVSTKPVKPGDLPQAIDADIVVDVTATTTAAEEVALVSALDVRVGALRINDDTFEAIRNHFMALFEPGDRVCITLIHATEKTPTGAAKSDNSYLSREVTITHDTVAELLSYNDQGYNVYAACNPVVAGAEKRTKNYAGECRNVFCECDENGDAVLAAVRAAVAAGDVPPPTVVLQSSPAKYQFLWRIRSEDFTPDKIEAVNRGLVEKFGADPACTDILRVFRVPGLRNWKYDNRPEVRIIELNPDARCGFADFRIPIGDTHVAVVKPPADENELYDIASYFEEAADEAQVRRSPLKQWGSNGYLWEITCPWVHEHTGQKDSGTVVILHNSGALDFVCQHGHCKERHWKRAEPTDANISVRDWMEKKVGHELRFAKRPDRLLFADGTTATESPATDDTTVTDATAATTEPSNNTAALACLGNVVDDGNHEPKDGENRSSYKAIGKDGVDVDRAIVNLSDVGNACRLHQFCGRNLWYCSEDDSWRVFDGQIWQLDRKSTQTAHLMKGVLTDIQVQAQKLLSEIPGPILAALQVKVGSTGRIKPGITLTPEERKWKEQYVLAASNDLWARVSESNQHIANSVEKAKSECHRKIDKSKFDANPYICNVRNGTLEINPKTASVSFRPHRREDLCTRMMPVDYVEGADCPEFKAFLDWMFGDKPEKEQYIQFILTFLGLCLTGVVVRTILILYGEGSNGKSTLVKVLSQILGTDRSGYAVSAAFSTFSVGREEQAGGTRSDLLRVVDRRFITAAESNQAKTKLDMARLKEMTGGDQTTARGLYQTEDVSFYCVGKILLQTNNRPAISDDSDGAWERLKLIKCSNQVSLSKQDKTLPQRIIDTEASGILNLLLKHALEYFRRESQGVPGLDVPATVHADTEQYRGIENHMSRFVAEECEVFPGKSIRESSHLVFQRYGKWCADNSEQPGSNRSLTQYLSRRFKVESKRARDGKVLEGIRLKTEQEKDIAETPANTSGTTATTASLF